MSRVWRILFALCVAVGILLGAEAAVIEVLANPCGNNVCS